LGGIKLPTFVVYKNKNNIIMKPQNKIEKVSLIIAAIYAAVTFGGAVVILLNI
jgi:hypothetical protein